MDQAAALREEAIALHRAGRLPEAEQRYQRSLQHNPQDAGARHMLGTLRLQQGRAAEALRLLEDARALAPDNPELVAHHGLALHVLERYDEALTVFDRALVLAPGLANVHAYRGNTLRALGRHEEALDSYGRLLALAPDYAEGWFGCGVALWSLGRNEEALAAYGRAVTIDPAHARAWYNRGVLLQQTGRPAEALECHDRAVRLMPDFTEAWNNRGSAQLVLARWRDALGSIERALSLDPANAQAWCNRGSVLQKLENFTAALESFDRALSLRPDFADALCNRGILLCTNRYLADALSSLDRAVAIDPGHAEAWYNRGVALQGLDRYDEALASFETALALKPDHPYAPGSAAGMVLNLCDWPRRLRYGETVRRVVEEGGVVSPLTFLNYCTDEALCRRCAENYLRDRLPSRFAPSWSGRCYRHDKIRIAYLSADFHEHATARLMAGLFESHDRRRFEVTAISFGHDEDTAMRSRLRKAFDRFVDVQGQGDSDVARLLHEMQIDIAVDLKGHTQEARPGILARRPCPVQVQYLGYPGTMGADFIDYVIADRIVLPESRQADYAERIVHLPHCYQANDRDRTIGAAPSRAQAGLPEHGFAFCCFNNSWKIAPEFFDVWMRLLAGVPDSILWLLDDNQTAKANLRREAEARGIVAGRLVFAPRVAQPAHLARHATADLFLDTLPYNAHTTASDALWAGLPLLTCSNSAFAGRAAASLLHAIGLPELVTQSLEDYEILALKLARDPARLAAIRAKLAANRLVAPLFDTERFARDIETAYAKMIEIARSGGSPQSFAVQ